MSRLRNGLVLGWLLWAALPLRAGLYNTAEPPVPLDGRVVDFLNRLKQLRGYAPADAFGGESPERKDYLKKVEALRGRGRLSAQEQANLGAYLIRLRKTSPVGRDYEEALQVLETARREHPRDFYILANLGTVYQLSGQIELAVGCLEEASALAPASLRAFERHHLRLVQLRSRERLRLGQAPLDELFPVRFIGQGGTWTPGALADEQKQRLPADALKVVQQLLVWLPEDGRLHWLLGEVANARGDIIGADKALDAAVFTFRLSMPELKERRQLLREAVDKLPRTSGLEQFAFPGAETPAAEYDWQLGWRGWTAIGVGVVLALALAALQVRELRRRRSARARG